LPTLSDAAIDARGLSKRYQLGQREVSGGLRDAISRAAAAPFVWLRRRANGDAPPPRGDWIWALRDLSFRIEPGEIVGIVGRNGSGKSTLLKILSRITEPTAGEAVVRGRVGSLLEVGTGFHPELTGRENVYVNGAILGMKRAEIARKFDEVVAFADVGPFIDTPVKHYSSGMQMRLAFSVAAHLEPEILLVDEVLAVGDIAFQKKCLGKLDDVRHDGRTVLFVSHQMNQLRRLCGRCLWLEEGRLVESGPADLVINRYEASFMDATATRELDAGRQGAVFLSWSLGATGSGHHTLTDFGPVTLRFLLRIDRPVKNGHHGITLQNRDGLLLWGAGTDKLSLQPGLYELVYWFESLPLRPGPYRWHVSLFDDHRFICNLDCVPELSVETRPLGHPRDEYAGQLNLPFSIKVQATVASRAPLDEGVVAYGAGAKG
jgi:ABC-type polysaccharide/polyol phosphate transport system ATPase subunit